MVPVRFTPDASTKPSDGAACYIPLVRELLRKHWRFFLLTTLAGLALRFVFLFFSPQVTDDSRIYADIATNWLSHGTYGTTEAGHIVPTFIRLPGYPAFLAILFALFGKDNFRAVLLIQVLIDLGTCFVIADTARRTTCGSRIEDLPSRASRFAFLLAAVCPFFANYAAAVLTETLEVFATILALDLAIAALNRHTDSASRFPWPAWAGSGISIAGAILLRPDGGILLIPLGGYLFYLGLEPFLTRTPSIQLRKVLTIREALLAGVILSGLALAPLAPWTLRNLQTLHQFQPLAPRYATNPGEYVPSGFNLWVKTWMADYVSVEEIYWQEPGNEIDVTKLPMRAFDSPEQERRTVELLDRYNDRKRINVSLDAQFAALARERIDSSPMRFYVWLPLLRIADMWLRPRTELTQADPRWWEFNDDPKYSVLSLAFGIINFIYVALACIGILQAKTVRRFAPLLLFLLVRSLFLGSLENPEPRYTLECYPVLIVLAAVAGATFWPLRKPGLAFGNR